MFVADSFLVLSPGAKYLFGQKCTGSFLFSVNSRYCSDATDSHWILNWMGQTNKEVTFSLFSINGITKSNPCCSKNRFLFQETIIPMKEVANIGYKGIDSAEIHKICQRLPSCFSLVSVGMTDLINCINDYFGLINCKIFGLQLSE